MVAQALAKRLAELRGEVILSTASFKDDEARHACIKSDVHDRLRSLLSKVDPDRASRAAMELLEHDNKLLLSYIADPFLIRTPILPILNKIKQSENRAKLEALKETDTLPQNVPPPERGDHDNV